MARPVGVVQQSTAGKAHAACACFHHRRRAMTNKSKIAMSLTLATIRIASPAFAQSFDPDNVTGNVLSFNNQSAESYAQALPKVSTHQKAIRHGKGLHAFAMAPRTEVGSVSDDPANAGGGIGYNELLKIY